MSSATDKKYKIIVADPPWQYQNKASRGAAVNHYPTMSMADLLDMRVGDYADKPSVLCMWYTGLFVGEARALATAWGFKVRTMKLLTWVKLNKCYKDHIDRAIRRGEIASSNDFMRILNEQTRMNGGNYTRSNTEDMLLATRGDILPRLDRSIKQVVYAPISRHSVKPPEALDRVVRLFGDLPRLELFSRASAPGWDTWGNQAPDCVDLDMIHK